MLHSKRFTMKIHNLGLTTTAAALLLGSLGLSVGLNIATAQADTAPTEMPFSTPGLKQQSGRSDGEFSRGRYHRGERLAEAAAELGVSETELRTALGLPEQPIEPDLAGAAAQLGTTETELRNSLRDSTQAGSGRWGRRPNFDAVAQQYGVSTEALLTALGVPAQRPRPDIAAAAERLGVSEDDIWDALRPNCRRD